MKRPGWWDYCWYAFRMPANLMLLAGLALLFLLFRGSPVVFWLVLLVEGIFLSFITSSAAFRRQVHIHLQDQRDYSLTHDWMAALKQLPKAQREHFSRLLKLRRKLERQLSVTAADFPDVMDDLAGKLDGLALVYARLLHQQESLRHLLATQPEVLEQELLKLERKLALADNERLKTSLAATLEMKQHRHQLCKQASENLDLINAELDRTEEQVHLLLSRILVQRDPQQWSDELDLLGQQLGNCEQLLAGLEGVESQPSPTRRQSAGA